MRKMVKLIHTADWHLGQSFYRMSKEEEHEDFFRQLSDIVEKEKPDALLVSGDIFHVAMPAASAKKQFVNGVVNLHKKRPQMKIVITAGNHDSFQHLEAHRELWDCANVSVIGYPEYVGDGVSVVYDKMIVELKDEKDVMKAYIIAVPYVHPSKYGIFKELLTEVEKRNTQQVPVVMMAHLSIRDTQNEDLDDNVGGIDCVTPDEMGEGYDYLALGHIHIPKFVNGTNRKARYAGTPVQTSFDEDRGHSVSVVEIEKHNAQPQVREIEITNKKEYLTLPEEAKPFEEVLEEIRKIPDEKEGFLRLNILVKDSLQVDAEQRIYEVLKDKKMKFCLFDIHRPEDESRKAQVVFTVEQIRTLDPLDLAKSYYERKHKTEMPEELVALFEEAKLAVSIEE